MKKLMQRGLMVLIFCLLSLSASAEESTSCDLNLIDQANIIHGNALSEVWSAYGAFGAKVRIRTVTQRTMEESGSANLDQYHAKMIQQCPSWVGAEEGTVASNMVVFYFKHAEVVSQLDRQLYSGTEYGCVIGKIARKHIPNVMRPELIKAWPNGDFGPGFRDGFVYAAGLIQMAIDANSCAVIDNSLSRKTRTSSPISSSTVASAIVLLVMFAILAYYFLSERPRFQKLQAAKQKLADAQVQCTLVVDKIAGSSKEVDSIIRSLTSIAGGDDLFLLGEMITAYRDQTLKPLSRYSTLTDRHLSDVASVTTTTSDFSRLLPRLEKLRSAQVDLLAKFQGIYELVDNPDIVKVVEDESERTRVFTQSLDDFFSIERLKPLWDAGNRHLRLAKDAVTGHHFVAAYHELTVARSSYSLIRKTAEVMPRWLSDLQELQPRLVQRMAEARTQRKLVTEILANLRDNYAHKNWRMVAANDDVALKHLNSATERLKTLALWIGSVSNQNLVPAMRVADMAGRRLDLAEAKMQAVLNRWETIKAAEAVIEVEIKDAAVAYKRLRDYLFIDHSGVDEVSKQERLNSIFAKIEEAEHLVNLTKPDFLTALTSAQSARAEAETLLQIVQQNHQSYEGSRTTAVAILQQAKVTIETTVFYINGHLSVKEKARRNLIEAVHLHTEAHKTLLEGLQSEDEDLFKRATKLAESANKKAEKALKRAKSNVYKHNNPRNDYADYAGGGAYGGGYESTYSAPTYTSAPAPTSGGGASGSAVKSSFAGL